MNEQTQLKLQAFLDGELSAGEREEFESLLQRDAEANALLLELKHTSKALAGFEDGIKLPEARDFYWSKIQGQIGHEELVHAHRSSRLAWLRRILVPVGSFAAVVLAVLLSLPKSEETLGMVTYTSEGVAFTYQNYETGTTLVWLDFPENNFSETDVIDNLGL